MRNDAHELSEGRHLQLFRSLGQLELPAGESSPDDPLREALRGKVEQLRKAQDAGRLDPAWEPEDILMFVSQLALAWAGQNDLAPIGEERDAFLAARRTAIVAAVQRLFPATGTAMNT